MMNQNVLKALSTVAVMSALVFGTGSAQAGNPFDEDSAVTPSKETEVKASAAAAGEIQAINGLKESLNARNQYTGVYKARVLGFAVSKGTVKFDDLTDKIKYQRADWFKKILSEHGCQTDSYSATEAQKGKWGIFSGKKMVVSSVFRGREFVVQAISSHYGGSVDAVQAAPVTPALPGLETAINLENKNIEIEKAILGLEFEIDQLFNELNEYQGILEGSKKSEVEKKIDGKKKEIAALKGSIAKNRDEVSKSLLNSALALENNGEYEKAIAYLNFFDLWDNNTRTHAANCYEHLGDYDSAIGMYEKLSPMTDSIKMDIANCNHLKGDDTKAVKGLLEVLGSFKSSPDQLDALDKIDEWKLLSKKSEFPELPRKISDIYLQKSFIDSKDSAKASEDYRKACSIRADAESSAPKAVSDTIIGGYYKAYQNAANAYQSAVEATGNRFMAERTEAERMVGVRKDEYQKKLDAAPGAYNSEITRRETELSRERQTLSSYEVSFRTAQNDLMNAKTRQASADSNYDSARRSYDDAVRELRRLEREYQDQQTDPYDDDDDSTDPYDHGSSGTTSGTDPYDDDDDESSTDPYDYYVSSSDLDAARRRVSDRDYYMDRAYSELSSANSVLSNAQTNYDKWNRNVSNQSSKVNTLNSQYTDLLKNKDGYIKNYVAPELKNLTAAEKKFNVDYAMSNKESYISRDAEVSRKLSAQSQAGNEHNAIKSFATGAGLN